MSRAEATCDVCGHPGAMGMCWRLTCPTNGGSMALVDMLQRPEGEDGLFAAAKRKSADRARTVKFGHPATWGEPPEPEFML